MMVSLSTVCISTQTFFFLLLASVSLTSDAFTCSSLVRSFRHGSIVSSPTQLSMAAKKKQRRRKDGKSKAPVSPRVVDSPEETAVPVLSDLDDVDLPDFDLGDDEPIAAATEAEAPASATKKAAPSSSKDVSVLSARGMDLEDPRVLEAMKGSKTTGPQSVDQLLRDRSLEKSFKFDPAGEGALPTLGEIASSPRSGFGDKGSDRDMDEAKIGKKRARAEARRAAAIEAEEAAKEEGGFLSNIPQFVGEDGKVSPLKILEAGTWAGIFALVAWEVYLNSPFFDRAAPMAPVVYQLWL